MSTATASKTATFLDADAPWSDPRLAVLICEAFDALGTTPSCEQIVIATEVACEEVGYDSTDRQEAWLVAERMFGMTYRDIYQTWLHRD